MTKTINKSNSTKTMVATAILTALVLVLQFMGQFIRLGPFMISLVLIPIVIGAAIGGTKSGAWLGFVFGVVVLISGDAAVFLAVDAFGTVLTVLAKGTLAGLAAGFVYQLFEKKNRYLGVILAAIVCPVVNTGVFLLGCLAFFMDTVTAWANGGNVVAYMFLGLVGGNFIVELGFNLILSPVVVRIIDIAEKRFGKKTKNSLTEKKKEEKSYKDNIIDLAVCEICAISAALVIDCLVFFNYFKSATLPIILIVVFVLIAVGSIVGRVIYRKKKTTEDSNN